MTVKTTSVSAIVNQVRQRLGYISLENYGVIEVSGPDAADFLHAQTTHDVLALVPGTGQASALLDRKAHVQAYFSLHCLEPQRFWLFLQQDLISRTLERLEQYHFTEDITVQDRSSEYHVFALQGPETPSFLRACFPETALTLLEENRIGAIDSSWGVEMLLMGKSFTGEAGVCIWVPTAQANALESQLIEAGKSYSMTQITPEALEILRIEAGLPQYGVDMDEETVFPATGLEQIAVSYTKGCYQGQEVVAKIKTYGAVHQTLVGLIFDAERVPPAHQNCILEGKVIGKTTSTTYSPTLQAPIAMAYLQRDYRIPGKTLHLEIAAEAYTATVQLLPFYKPLAADEAAKARYNEGLRLFSADQDEAAIAALREAIAQDPHFADAYEALGVILARQDQYDEAIALMHKLTEIDPESVMAHTNLSVFYMKKGMKTEAEVEKEKATVISFQKAMSQQQKAKNEAAQRLQQKQALEEKVRMFQEVLELDPQDALAHYGLGNTYLALERFAEAVPLLQQAIELDPKHTASYLALGKAFEALAEAEQAKAAYQKGIEVAAKRGDLMPLQEMEKRLADL